MGIQKGFDDTFGLLSLIINGLIMTAFYQGVVSWVVVILQAASGVNFVAILEYTKLHWILGLALSVLSIYALNRYNLRYKKKGGLWKITLAVIVLSLLVQAGGYMVLRGSISPAIPDSQACSQDTDISVSGYDCSNYSLLLTVENRGFFSIDGFFINGTNDSNEIPLEALSRHDFKEKFMPGQSENLTFDYRPINSVQRIRLQPFIIGENEEVIICPSIADGKVDCP